MNLFGRAAVLLCLGLVAGQLALSGGFRWFVQEHMRIPLLLSSAVLLLLGVALLVRFIREPEDQDIEADPHDPHDHHGHAHGPTPRIGWLLTLPAFVLIGVAPTALGAAAVDRAATTTPAESGGRFDPLPDGVVEMPVVDFVTRAFWDEDRTLADRTVELVGFVVADPAVPDGFLLTRFVLRCCAADAFPVQVAVRGAGLDLEDDQWVVVRGSWVEPGPEGYPVGDNPMVELRPDEVERLPGPPDQPYESVF